MAYGYVEKIEVDRAKQAAREEYLQPFRNRVVDREREVSDAEDRLRRALNDLSSAEADAERWYGRGV